jgi:putative chitinase
MSLLTEARLAAFLPNLNDVPVWTAALDEAMDRFEIDSPERTAAFLAQIACESAECRRFTERLNYTAKRLMAVWPKRGGAVGRTILAIAPPERTRRQSKRR